MKFVKNTEPKNFLMESVGINQDKNGVESVKCTLIGKTPIVHAAIQNYE